MIVLGLGLTTDEAPQFGEDTQVMKAKFASIFASKTQAEWCSIFDDVDACVAPVVQLKHAHQHPHNVDRKSFLQVSNDLTLRGTLLHDFDWFFAAIRWIVATEASSIAESHTGKCRLQI